MTQDEIYKQLHEAAGQCGFVGDHADELLQQAAESIANDPRNEEDELAVVDDMTDEALNDRFNEAVDKDD